LRTPLYQRALQFQIMSVLRKWRACFSRGRSLDFTAEFAHRGVARERAKSAMAIWRRRLRIAPQAAAACVHFTRTRHYKVKACAIRLWAAACRWLVAASRTCALGLSLLFHRAMLQWRDGMFCQSQRRASQVVLHDAARFPIKTMVSARRKSTACLHKWADAACKSRASAITLTKWVETQRRAALANMLQRWRVRAAEWREIGSPPERRRRHCRTDMRSLIWS
jgi:hypothetical protein